MMGGEADKEVKQVVRKTIYKEVLGTWSCEATISYELAWSFWFRFFSTGEKNCIFVSFTVLRNWTQSLANARQMTFYCATFPQPNTVSCLNYCVLFAFYHNSQSVSKLISTMYLWSILFKSSIVRKLPKQAGYSRDLLSKLTLLSESFWATFCFLAY